MAKRYHSSDPRKMMKQDGGMIHDDWSAPALLPRQVIDKEWPARHQYSGGYVDDLFMGVSKQLSEDASDLKRIMKPKKY